MLSIEEINLILQFAGLIVGIIPIIQTWHKR